MRWVIADAEVQDAGDGPLFPMTFRLSIHGAAGRVTGSLYLVEVDDHKVLLECGLIQGSRKDEALNTEPFPLPINDIDAVILSHAHIDHSGRIPLLFRRGYKGPVYAQNATVALCEIMLPDSGYLHEKDAEWTNRHRLDRGEPIVEPLYTRADAERCLDQFRGIAYDESTDVVPGLSVRFLDAGHILGSAIVELRYARNGVRKTVVFSGDIGGRQSPVMRPPVALASADVVMMESTYGDRLHRDFDATISELADVFESARAAGGNILIPAFAVGRTQDLLYLLSKHRDDWNLDNWHVFLDSPMAIQATEVYSNYQRLYDARFFEPGSFQPRLANFHATRSTEESMLINQIRSGAIIIAGSGMCTGGRIRHHLKNNVSRPANHVVIVGFQAYGTPGRRLVDGADTIRMWGEHYRVRATVHTIGGLSAHGDQQDLLDWYGHFVHRPPLCLVHGEPDAQVELKRAVESRFSSPVTIATTGQVIEP